MKLKNTKTSSKTYLKILSKILKTFYDGRKIPITPPILKEGKLGSDFKIKANYFNCFFASQCTILVNNSKLPDKLLTTLQLDLLPLSLTK